MKQEIKVGDAFGLWTVIAPAETRQVNEYHLCRCKCGALRSVFRGSLLNHRSKSCGCSKRKRKNVNPAK